MILLCESVKNILMAKVSPSPSVHFDYKKETPVAENDPSSTNNLWFYNLQFVAITILFVVFVEFYFIFLL